MQLALRSFSAFVDRSFSGRLIDTPAHRDGTPRVAGFEDLRHSSCETLRMGNNWVSELIDMMGVIE
jgi:hypothetical protein